MPPRSVNDILFDRNIRHAHFLARLSSGEANKIVRFLEREVYPDITRLIEQRLDRARTGSVRGLHSTKRLQDIQRDIEQLIREGHQAAYSQTVAIMRDSAIVEARFTQKLMTDTLGKFGLSPTMPSTPLLRAIVADSPIRGELLVDQYAGMTARTRAAVRSAINIGLVEGESTSQIVRRLRGSSVNPGGVLAASRTEARRIVRTAVNHTTTQARELTYDDNSDLVKGVRWVATLDSRTSRICISLDGQVFKLDEGPRPPAHHNCRSTTTPVIKSWKELGINLPDAPRGTRASLNGQVPADTTYPDWLKSQPIPVQNEVLGRRLATEWRAGRVTVDKFIDSQYRPLSLKDILRLEGLD